MAVVGVDAARPDEADDVQRPPGRAPVHASSSAGRVANDPSAIAASIRGRSWRTGRPAPRLRCPTSELPIWPAGSPTASSERPERRVRPVAQERTPGRHRRGRDRVGGRVAPDPEPVEDDEDDRTRSGPTARRRPVAPVTPRRSGRGGQPGPRHDAGHLVRLERSAADERAVDRRLGQELGDVRRGDAAAVQDRHVSARVRQPSLASARRIASAIAAASRPLAFRPVPIAQTGSYAMTRPAARERGRLMSAQGAAQLAIDDGRPARPASRSASRSPTHRIGRRPASTARRELAADQLVGLAGVAPALGVADDDPVREAGEHRRRDLAGVRALELVMDVLGADPDVRVGLGERVADRGEADERRADDPGHAGHPRPRRDRPREVARVGRGRVHLPIAGDDHVTHRAESCQSGRGLRTAAVRLDVARRSSRSRARWTAERWISSRSASSARLASGVSRRASATSRTT